MPAKTPSSGEPLPDPAKADAKTVAAAAGGGAVWPAVGLCMVARCDRPASAGTGRESANLAGAHWRSALGSGAALSGSPNCSQPPDGSSVGAEKGWEAAGAASGAVDCGGGTAGVCSGVRKLSTAIGCCRFRGGCLTALVIRAPAASVIRVTAAPDCTGEEEGPPRVQAVGAAAEAGTMPAALRRATQLLAQGPQRLRRPQLLPQLPPLSKGCAGRRLGTRCGSDPSLRPAALHSLLRRLKRRQLPAAYWMALRAQPLGQNVSARRRVSAADTSAQPARAPGPSQGSQRCTRIMGSSSWTTDAFVSYVWRVLQSRLPGRLQKLQDPKLKYTVRDGNGLQPGPIRALHACCAKKIDGWHMTGVKP